ANPRVKQQKAGVDRVCQHLNDAPSQLKRFGDCRAKYNLAVPNKNFSGPFAPIRIGYRDDFGGCTATITDQIVFRRRKRSEGVVDRQSVPTHAAASWPEYTHQRPETPLAAIGFNGVAGDLL